MSFRYGQTHDVELKAAQAQAAAVGAREHVVVDIDLASIGGTRLVRDGRRPAVEDSEIPATYVPARNTIFLAFALGWAEVLDADAIFIGVNAIDYSGYPDCRPQFIQAFERVARLATRAGVEGRSQVRIEAPLLHCTKAEIVRRALEHGVDLAHTHSCYFPDAEGRPCGTCASCRLRRKGFAAAGVPDPLPYPADTDA
jgi:7-cyano-7-deazaguanine synthase